MAIFLAVIIGLALACGVALYLCARILDKSNNFGDFSGNADTLSTRGVVYTSSVDRVRKNTIPDRGYYGCPFQINGR